MFGRTFQAVDWRDVGGAVGYSEDIEEGSLLDYLHAVLLEDVPSIVFEAFPAEKPKSSREQRLENVTWHTYALLTLANAPLTLSGLAAMQKTGIPVVREGVAELERLGLVKFAKLSRLVFRTQKERRA